MSSTTVKRVETLKGVFSVPKVEYRRDFMRENKLKLRDIQRQASEKQELLERKYQKEQQYLGRRRSSSLHRTPSAQSSTGKRESVQIVNNSASRHSLTKQGSFSNTGSKNSLTRQSNLVSNGSGMNLTNSTKSNYDLNKKKSCDKEIQTEDIQDEEFLYNALKKITSNNLYREQVNDERLNAGSNEFSMPETQMRNGYNRDSAYEDGGELEFQEPAQIPYNENDYRQLENEQRQTPLASARSHRSIVNDYAEQAQHSSANYDQTRLQNNNTNYCDNQVNEPVSHRGSQTSIANSVKIKNRESKLNANTSNLSVHDKPKDGQSLSGRSNKSVNSFTSQGALLCSKKSNSNLHSHGSRDDIRLPRYLEREKREKEEQRLQEMSRDPDCPDDHYVLTEEHRVSALMGAEKKYRNLIDELNSLPMTMETLRIRNRKCKIEKELQRVESDIRLFSKNKVYLKNPD